MRTKKRSGNPRDTNSSITANRKATRTPGKKTRKAKAAPKNARAGSASPLGRGRKIPARASRRGKPPVRATDFEYDVCLSFAGENRSYVTRVAAYLKAKGARVFYDVDEQLKLWSADLYAYLDDIYRKVGSDHVGLPRLIGRQGAARPAPRD